MFRILACFFTMTIAIAATDNAVFGDSPKNQSPKSQNPKDGIPTQSMQYPDTATVDVSDDYHGNIVADPYRWLEDTESSETAAWIEAQNKVTDAYLESLPERVAMQKRLETLWNYERYGMPIAKGEHYFYTHNNGLQDQSIFYKAASLGADREVLIDPNTLSEDGTVALAGIALSRDGELCAYSLADGGSDWRTWKVRSVQTGNDLPDLVEWVKFSGIAWMPDNSGFFYARYAQPVEGEALLGTNENQRLFFHKLGDDQSQDQLIFEWPDEPKWGFSPIVSDDGDYLIIHNRKTTDPESQLFYKDLRDPDAKVEPLIVGFDAEYQYIASRGKRMFIKTDNEAPKRRLIAVTVGDDDRSGWEEVVAECGDVLESASLFGETFYLDYLQDARSRVARCRITGEPLEDLPLPGVGSVSGFGGREDATETFFSFTNYVTPTSIYRLDLENGKTSLWRSPEIAIDTSDFITEQIFATSKDGTQVPIIVTRHRNTKLDGSNRTLLYGYGGFNISITPSFSPANAAWIDSGGVYAIATLRGGGEYGREWHRAGMRLKKQNVFDDFIAAAEHLIDAKYTKSNLLAISGRSNGGLLVGAVMTQRPDLFGACLPGVGVLDMLRYHKFTIGWAWVGEYGSSDEADQVANLLSYSPLHNLKPGTCYPATLITTADRDDRVVPGHSFKYAAALQAAQRCAAPTLIRIETRAGHGAGTPVSKRIDEYADLWSFLIANLK